jgi:hypothetical protein
MKDTITVQALVLCACTLNAATLAAEEFNGDWTMMPANEAGKVHVVLQGPERGIGHSVADLFVSSFQGLDLATRVRHDVEFVIARDAGRFDCDGYLNEGEGTGVFRFTRDAGFVRAMRALGFRGIDQGKQFAMALHDVTLDFARQMEAEEISGLNTDQLVAFRLFGVSQEFIRAMRLEGARAPDADELIAFRVHRVSPEFVATIESLGYADVGLKPVAVSSKSEGFTDPLHH